MSIFSRLVSAAVIVAAAASPAQAQENPVDPSAAYVHSATGVSFPAVVSKFERVRVAVSPDGRKIDVTYAIRGTGKQVSVAIVPDPGAPCGVLRGGFEASVDQLDGATPETNPPLLTLFPSAAAEQHTAQYVVAAGSSTSPGYESKFLTWIGCVKGRGQVVTLISAFPSSGESSSISEVYDLFLTINWRSLIG